MKGGGVKFPGFGGGRFPRSHPGARHGATSAGQSGDLGEEDARTEIKMKMKMKKERRRGMGLGDGKQGSGVRIW